MQTGRGRGSILIWLEGHAMPKYESTILVVEYMSPTTSF